MTFRNAAKRVLLIQFLVFLLLIIIDLYVFRGFYSSEIIINPNHPFITENNSCCFKIKKETDDKYIFTFKNYSLFPKYLMNYRNEQYFQSVHSDLFFNYIDAIIFPAYGTDYNLNFDCGTGLGLSSINPFESFKVEMTYKEIIEDISWLDILSNSMYLEERYSFEKPFYDLEYDEIDSLIVEVSQNVLITDSVQVEYFVPLYSFVSKDRINMESNKVTVSMKDILDEYMKNYHN